MIVTPTPSLLPFGTLVKLSGVPQHGSYFALWGNAASGTNNPLSFLVTNANPTVSSLFGTLNAGQFALTVLVNGLGTVATSPSANRFSSGQSVSLVALPDADQVFLYWSGDATGSQTNLTLAMTQSRTIIASFSRKPRLSLWECGGHPFFRGLRFLLHGEIGLRYQLERSSDLSTWTPRTIVTNVSGTIQFDDPTILINTQRFYRANAILP